LAQIRQGAAMKLIRNGVIVGCLALTPQLASARDEALWHGIRTPQPTWKASSSAKFMSSAAPAARGWSVDASTQSPVEWTISNGCDEPFAVKQENALTPAFHRSAPEAAVGRNASERIGTSLPPTAEQPVEPLLLPGNNLPSEDATQPKSVEIEPAKMPAWTVNVPAGPTEVVSIAPQTQGAPDGAAGRAAEIQPPTTSCRPALLCRPIMAAKRAFPGVFGAPGDPANAGANQSFGLIDALSSKGMQFTASAEYLLWWSNRDSVPLLASTGTQAGVGVVGQPGTQALFGPGAVGSALRNGGRFRASLLVDETTGWGVDASFLFLAQSQANFAVNSDQYPVLSRPVFVLNNRTEGAETVAFPNFSTGSLQISTATQLTGGDVNIFKRLLTTSDYTINAFTGYRYLNLSESVQIVEAITAGANAPDPAGTHIGVSDRFATRNLFNGGQIGASIERRWNSFFVNMRSSVAFGVNEQTIDVEGFQVKTVPGQAPQVFQGGLLAARSNIGNFERNRFSVVPDVALNFGYQVTPHFRVYAGYNIIYWTSVLRPGQQIDRTVDLTLIPNTPPVAPSGQNRPAVPFTQSDFLAHGINFGLEWMW
jgi:hypothetical protein